MKHSHIAIALLALLILPATTMIPTASASSDAFARLRASAGLLVTNIPAAVPLPTDPPTVAQGFLAIDAYHIRESTYGRDYDLVAYALAVPTVPIELFNPGDPSTYAAVPLFFATNNPSLGDALVDDFGPVFQGKVNYWPLAITAKGNTLLVQNLPAAVVYAALGVATPEALAFAKGAKALLEDTVAGVPPSIVISYDYERASLNETQAGYSYAGFDHAGAYYAEGLMITISPADRYVMSVVAAQMQVTVLQKTVANRGLSQMLGKVSQELFRAIVAGQMQMYARSLRGVSSAVRLVETIARDAVKLKAETVVPVLTGVVQFLYVSSKSLAQGLGATLQGSRLRVFNQAVQRAERLYANGTYHEAFQQLSVAVTIATT